MPTAVIIGREASGFFAAITCAEANPGHSVIISEATGEVGQTMDTRILLTEDSGHTHIGPA